MLRYSFSTPLASAHNSSSQKFEDTAEGWAAFKAALASTSPAAFSLSVEATELLEPAVKNLLAVIQKSAHHLYRVGCYAAPITPQNTLWRNEAPLMEAFESLRPRWPRGISVAMTPSCTAVGAGAYDLAFKFTCIKPNPATDLCKAFTRRCVNLCGWPFGEPTRLRLTSPTPVKWATFEEISKFRRIGIVERN